MERAVVTLIGKDKVGIISKVCLYFANNGMNILDISQTTMKSVINMAMIIDISTQKKDFDSIVKGIEELSDDVGCVIHVYKEEDLMKMSE